MLNAAFVAMGLKPAEDFSNPITYRYVVAGPDGSVYQELTVDVPAVRGNADATIALGPLLWGASIAGAITGDYGLLMCSATAWTDAASSGSALNPNVRGGVSGAPAPREDCGVMVMSTYAVGTYGNKRLFLLGIPARWVSSRQLTDVGRRALEGQAQKMVMGMCGHLVGGPLAWLLAYPGLVEATETNPGGAAFTRVEYVSVMQHTARVPPPGP